MSMNAPRPVSLPPANGRAPPAGDTDGKSKQLAKMKSAASLLKVSKTPWSYFLLPCICACPACRLLASPEHRAAQAVKVTKALKKPSTGSQYEEADDE
jgi:hypothetical protein